MIHYKKDTDNIVTLTLDMQGRQANVFNHEIREAFLPVLTHLQQEKQKGTLRGVILTSAKKSFLAGGDLDYLYKATDPSEIFQFAEAMKDFLRALERPGVSVVAAINGSAIGAGFELALACHHRIALDDHRIRLGLPEVEIGLMPGGGGIVRLMWLLGIEKAFPILTNAHRYNPEEALRVGIIDELASNKKALLEKAKKWLLENREHRRPWDSKNALIPGGSSRDTKGKTLIRKLAAQLSAQNHNNYPAPQAILNVLAEGSKLDFDTACRIESRYYTELVLSKQSKNMIKAFWFDGNTIKAGQNRPRGFGKFRPKKVGVIGAGQMGSGIAYSCVLHGMEVVIKDISKPIAERGREFIRMKLQKGLEAGQIHEKASKSCLDRVQTTDNSKDFETCDLVIEAVFEHKLVKQKVAKEAEQFIDEYAFFATNTVSIPISELSRSSARPNHFIGLHFFHPAEEVPLVEIVRGANTSEETVAKAFDFVRAIDKVPIIVKDDWGFYAARVQNTYILEGVTMLEEGWPPALIENLGRQSGMPKGPLELGDDLGLDLVLKYEQQAAQHYGPKYVQHPAVKVLKMMLESHQRNGKKKGGFYDYEEESKKIWPELSSLFEASTVAFDAEELKDRFLVAQVIEAVWCMQEKVLQSSAAANLGSIYGWGFPAFKGGVLQYINDYGIEAFLEQTKILEKKFGQRFSSPRRLSHFAREAALL